MTRSLSPRQFNAVPRVGILALLFSWNPPAYAGLFGVSKTDGSGDDFFIARARPKNLQVDEIVRIEGSATPTLTSSSVPLRDPLASS
jgi:hypothetical protein